MKFMFNRSKGLIAAGILAIVAIMASMLIAGCAKTLDGDQFANKAPIVEFVNIPPGPVYDTVSTDPLVIDTQYTRFSRNPFVYWYGSDVDGQIDYYRYQVKTELELGSLTPQEYIASAVNDSTSWIYLDVVPTTADPKTTEVVKLRALSDDPLSTYLIQYVFLQAFDEMGLGSQVIYRAFSRNDSPPNTFISPVSSLSFINSVKPGNFTGVKIKWNALDPDYPGGDNIPLFDYQWRLYGPFEKYTVTSGGDSVLTFLTKYLSTVYVTPDSRVFYSGDTLEVCDTSLEDGSISCTLLQVGKDVLPTSLPGSLSKILDIKRLEAENDTVYNRLVYQSDGWTNDSTVTLFNVFKNHTSSVDTTVEMGFVFWVKSKDDADVEDLIPSYKPFKVINPKFERDFIVVDYNSVGNNTQINTPVLTSDSGNYFISRKFWKNVVDRWGKKNYGTAWDDSRFDIKLDKQGAAIDYIFGGKNVPITRLLKHKVVILYYDEVTSLQASFDNVYTAIDAGVNVWVIARNAVIGQKAGQIFESLIRDIKYAKYFAVTQTNYTNWLNYSQDSIYIQDFVGATSGSSLGNWPNLPIDSALLHKNYLWARISLGVKWIPEAPALPEVNWLAFLQRIPLDDGTTLKAEPIYLYKSLYGPGGHPLGGNIAAYHGSPVAHTVETENFRTVHFAFTPLALQPDSFQIAANRVFDFLYDETLSAPVTSKRYTPAF